MQKLRFVNGKGNEIDLTDNVNFGVVDWVGFSECGNEIQTQTVPFSDGAVFLDTLLSERELSVTVAVQDGGNLEKRYELKRELIKAFNPKLGEGYLYYKNDFLEKRIKVVPSLPIFPTKNSDTGGTLKAELSFTACNPYWEDVEETKIVSYENTVETQSDGDIDSSFVLVAQNVNPGNDNEINIKNKENETFILDKTINYKQSSDFCTVIDTNTGNKKAETYGLKYVYINTDQYDKTFKGVFAFGKQCFFFNDIYNRNYLKVSKDNFKSFSKHYINENVTIDVVRYSEKQKKIYFSFKKEPTATTVTTHICSIDEFYNVEEIISEASARDGSGFDIVDDENCSYLIRNHVENGGTFYIEIDTIENNEVVKRDITTSQSGRFLNCSTPLHSDDGTHLLVSCGSSYSGSEQEFLNDGTGFAKHGSSTGREEISHFQKHGNNVYVFYANYLNQTQNANYCKRLDIHNGYIRYNQVFDNYIGLSSSNSQLEAFFVRGQLYIISNSTIIAYGETYTQQLYFSTQLEVIDDVRETENGIEFFYHDKELSHSYNMYVMEKKGNAIEYINDLSSVIKMNGTKFESDCGFSVTFRNKYIGV